MRRGGEQVKPKEAGAEVGKVLIEVLVPKLTEKSALSIKLEPPGLPPTCLHHLEVIGWVSDRIESQKEVTWVVYPLTPDLSL